MLTWGRGDKRANRTHSWTHRSEAVPPERSQDQCFSPAQAGDILILILTLILVSHHSIYFWAPFLLFSSPSWLNLLISDTLRYSCVFLEGSP